MAKPRQTPGALALLLAWAACHAPSAPGPVDPEPPPAASLPPPPAPPRADRPLPVYAGPAPLRRLTRIQYQNTVRDLLGADAATLSALVDDPRGPSGFPEAGLVGAEDLRGLMDAAERVAAAAVARLPALLPCAPATADARCVEAFVTDFGGRAFRRPLAPAEVAEAMRLFGTARGTLGYPPAEAVRVLLAGMLQSPKFLYHWERGCPGEGAAPGRPVRLCPHEIAARLSYFLWTTMPDAGLFAAAERGDLADDAGIEREARRMLADPRARDTIGWFHRHWLELGPLEPATAPYPTTRGSRIGYEPSQQAALLRSMDAETWEFAAQVVGSGDGRLETLLAAPYSFIDDRLAGLYGAPPVTDPGLVRRPLDHRRGLLTHASFLWLHATAHASHPIKRGRVIYERLLCGQVPPPPDDVTPPRADTPTTSTRERYAQHLQNECARSCHMLIDPPGFALESFDGLGRHRSEDGGKPVDSSGVAIFPLEGPRPFADTDAFLRLLSTSEDVRRCVTRQWFRYALGRAEVAGDAAALDRVHDRFARSGWNVRELLVAVTRAPSFVYRGATP